jgi:Xaa-Pro aminopeptidase
MVDEFSRRRERVLRAMEPAVMLLPSAPLALRNNDVEHEYRQDSDFYYLTGFDEPESVIVLKSLGEQPFVMFVRPRDKEREVWDGARAGLEGAVSDYGADAAHPISELSEKLGDLLAGCSRLYYRLGRDRNFDDIVLKAIDRLRSRARRGVAWPTEIADPSPLLHEMRLKKEPRELKLMDRAAAISTEAHLRAMAACRPSMYEYEIEALLVETFKKHGCQRAAYSPIVGSGPNATVLHHRKNDRLMHESDLLLIDAGCEYGYYASDITRTFPVSGRFSGAQRAIYEIVLESQLVAIDLVRPGATLEQIHDAAVKVIARGLCDLGFFSTSLEEVMEKTTYKTFFMHRTSHYLGMDVHDVGSYFRAGEPRPLEPGMVITVEPGIYIASDAEAPEAYRGIGVRIEDDVVVTEDGAEVLSARVPKRIADVEQACTS